MCRLILFFLFAFQIHLLKAEVPTFEEKENSGLNKFERIGLMEKFLVALPSEIKNLENKIEENNKTIKALESTVKLLKEENSKLALSHVDGAKDAGNKESGLTPKEALEFKKLKEDFISLKNQDIEPLQEQLGSLKIRLENIEKVLKISPRP